jgi:hypothetical protein
MELGQRLTQVMVSLNAQAVAETARRFWLLDGAKAQHLPYSGRWHTASMLLP